MDAGAATAQQDDERQVDVRYARGTASETGTFSLETALYYTRRAAA